MLFNIIAMMWCVAIDDSNVFCFLAVFSSNVIILSFILFICDILFIRVFFIAIDMPAFLDIVLFMMFFLLRTLHI